MSRRRWLAALAALLATLGITLAGAASAHALLLATTPGIGSEVPTEPTTVTLSFDQGVSGSARAIVVTANGQRLDNGEPVHPAGNDSELSVQLRPGPAQASYDVLWRVGSADGHAVDGSFSFGVGEAAGPAPALSSVAGSSLVQALDAAAEAAAYVGLVLAIGVSLVVGLLWPTATGRPRIRSLIAGGWALEVVATVALFLFQGPVTAGTGVSTLLSGVDTTVSTRVGRLLLARLLLLLLVLPALRRLLQRDGGATLDLGILGLLLAVSFPLGDHAGSGSYAPLFVTLGSLHVVAATIWLGGLAALAVSLLEQGRNLDLQRWSRLAAGCVLVLVVTGVIASIREVGGLAPLTSTTYGQTLLVKLAAVMALLGFGELARRGVARKVAAASLRRGVIAEAGLGIVILILTAALVASEPARDSYPAPVTLAFALLPDEGAASAIEAVVHIDRSRVGPETITVTLSRSGGEPPALASLDGLLTDTIHEDDPLRFPLVMGTPGHGIASVELPETGRWTLSLLARGGHGVASDYDGRAIYVVS